MNGKDLYMNTGKIEIVGVRKVGTNPNFYFIHSHFICIAGSNQSVHGKKLHMMIF